MTAGAAQASAAAGIIGRQCLARRARLLSRVITRIYDEALRPVDLKATQLTILVAISAAKRARPATLYRRFGARAVNVQPEHRADEAPGMGGGAPW